MTAEEVKAYIGMEECKVTTLSLNDFVCTPPEKQPPPKRVKRDLNSDLPEFVVCIFTSYDNSFQVKVIKL